MAASGAAVQSAAPPPDVEAAAFVAALGVSGMDMDEGEEEESPKCLNTNNCGHFLAISMDKLSARYNGNGKDGNDVGAVQGNKPAPSRCLYYYFEMTVADRGQRGAIAIGFTDKNFRMSRQPGWEPNSYGYHGDDGNLYHGWMTFDIFGPTFTTGDTVGAGINYLTQELFFTKNSSLVGEKRKDVKHALYPTVALHSPNETVFVNFGQSPFVFDVEALFQDIMNCNWNCIMQLELHHGKAGAGNVVEDSNGGEDKGRSMDCQTCELTDSMNYSSDSVSIMSMSVPEGAPLSAWVLTPRLSYGPWQKLGLLGSGSFGAVYTAVSSDGYFFAVKEVNMAGADEQSTLQLQQEIAVLSQCQHENVVQYLGSQRRDNALYIFLELMTQGSLVSQYKEYPLFDEQLRSYTRQILRGLSYLHDRKVVHRDIKCANILVNVHGTVKLADFGMAKELDMINSIKSSKGSPNWMAPEVVNPKKTASFPADIWSLGCTILEMATRRPPFNEYERNTVIWKVGNGEIPPIPDTLPADAQDFIAECLQVEPSNRPTAKKLLSHPFVTSTISSQNTSHGLDKPVTNIS